MNKTAGTYSYSNIWRVAYPILISLVMEQLIGLTDTAFMGRVGEVELGASAIAIIYGLYILIKTLVTGIDFPGYASTMVVMLFLGGIIELSIGIVGEYVARIFTESKKRPIYITKETNIKAITEEDSHEESDS